MTQMLKRAFDEASRHPQDLQDTIAAIVLAELAAQQRWDETFACSQDALSKLADEALAEHRAGRTKPLNVEDL